MSIATCIGATCSSAAAATLTVACPASSGTSALLAPPAMRFRPAFPAACTRAHASSPTPNSGRRGLGISAASAGVTCTLIDFTLSRLAAAQGAVAFCDLSADPELFAGPRGDPQAEAYRRMKKLTRGDWQAYTPATNAAWLHYLADACLTHKLPQVVVRVRAGRACLFRFHSTAALPAVPMAMPFGACRAWQHRASVRPNFLPPPPVQCPHGGEDKLALRGFRKRALGYASAGDALADEYFAGSWTAV